MSLRWYCLKLSFAALSAASFPCNPTWLGIHMKETNFPWSLNCLILNWTAVISATLSNMDSCCRTWRAERESVKIYILFSCRRRACFSATWMAYNSVCRVEDPLLILLLKVFSLCMKPEPALLAYWSTDPSVYITARSCCCSREITRRSRFLMSAREARA